MKRLFMLITLLIVSVSFIGCNSSDQENAAKEVVKQYKTSLYNIEDYNKTYQDYTADTEGFIKSLERYKKYFTDAGYDKFMANRTAAIPIEACEKGKYSLKVSNINFDKVTEEKDKLILDYTFSLKAVYANGEKTVDKKGQATLVKEGNEWKISIDWYDINNLFGEDFNPPK